MPFFWKILIGLRCFYSSHPVSDATLKESFITVRFYLFNKLFKQLSLKYFFLSQFISFVKIEGVYETCFKTKTYVFICNFAASGRNYLKYKAGKKYRFE